MAGKCFICGLEKIIVIYSYALLLLFRLIKMEMDGLIILKKNIIYEIIFIISIIYKTKRKWIKMGSNHIFIKWLFILFFL